MDLLRHSEEYLWPVLYKFYDHKFTFINYATVWSVNYDRNLILAKANYNRNLVLKYWSSDRSVITIVNYDYNTFIVQATGVIVHF